MFAYLVVYQLDRWFLGLLFVLARLPAKKSNVRFFHAEPTFFQNSPLCEVAEASFLSEKVPLGAEKLHIYSEMCIFVCLKIVKDEPEICFFCLFPF